MATTNDHAARLRSDHKLSFSGLTRQTPDPEDFHEFVPSLTHQSTVDEAIGTYEPFAQVTPEQERGKSVGASPTKFEPVPREIPRESHFKTADARQSPRTERDGYSVPRHGNAITYNVLNFESLTVAPQRSPVSHKEKRKSRRPLTSQNLRSEASLSEPCNAPSRRDQLAQTSA